MKPNLQKIIHAVSIKTEKVNILEGLNKVVFTTANLLLAIQNRCKSNNKKLNFVMVIGIIIPILLGSEEKSRDSGVRKAKLVSRGMEQDNHQHLGSESNNPGIQNPILLSSSNQD
ncbi:hypothetical protein BB560_004908 [Smittium megazygosporum]|uniref:Uncharacterized protein n=1 Tax=Smittium megazygosporum TaxID=133381 RepID=A0A2T9Z7X4_9FUNG|nr:hypothetical protein BB560_004908 [Smittium megazygosporum]